MSKLTEVPIRVLILGTGLIGASLGLALGTLGPLCEANILGWDPNPDELTRALDRGAIHQALPSREAVLLPGIADIYVLATPVLPILDWMHALAPVVHSHALVTDVGSTKQDIVRLASTLYNGPGQASFLPSHPMAGKESGGAALAEATLFRNATWLFTPLTTLPNPESRPLIHQWRTWIEALGTHTFDIEAAEHDRICAWVSHLPQMLSTALAALLEETFAGDPQGSALVAAIGGRALRETTRLGASPYSMWRDIALTNTAPIAATLFALEQGLSHLRENLRTPGLQDEFRSANRFRAQQPASGRRSAVDTEP